MEKKNNKKRTISILLIGIVLIIIYKLLDQIPEISAWLKNFFSIMLPINIGIIIAIFLYGPTKFFEKKFENSNNKFLKKKANAFSITLAYIIVILAIVILFSIITPMIIKSGQELFTNIGSYMQMFIDKLDSLSKYGINVDNIKNSIKNIDLTSILSFDNIFTYTKNIVNAGSSILNIFVAIIISIYILYERQHIYNFIIRILKASLPKTAFEKTKKYWDNALSIFIGFINAQVLDAIIIGILETIVLLILKVKYAPVLGFLIGISNIIPYFGAIAGVGITFIITIFSGGIMQSIWMLIAVTIMQQIDANIINPKIVGQQLEISPLLVIISVIIGGAYFGVAGMFLAVPVAALIKIILIDTINNRLKEKEEQDKQDKENKDKENKDKENKNKENKNKENKNKENKNKENIENKKDSATKTITQIHIGF